MKYLIMCEGDNEKTIMNILLDHKLLTLEENDLVGLRVYPSRQIDKTPMVKLELSHCTEKVTVYRIGDTLKDELKVKGYEDKIVCVKKYCTKPELERLVIIAAGLEKKYQKVKNNMQPKQFAKNEKIVINNSKYRNASEFFKEAFEDDVELLVNAIKEYKRIGNHTPEERYLADLLK